MKKIAILGLLTIFLFQSGGLMFLYVMQQEQASKLMQGEIKKPGIKFEHLTLSIDQFHKSKIDQKEIIVNGKLYDISSVILSGKNVHVLAIYDSFEEQIVNAINNFFDLNKSGKKEIPRLLVKLFASECIFTETTFSVHSNTLPSSRFFQKDISYLSFCPGTLSPPPKPNC